MRVDVYETMEAVEKAEASSTSLDAESKRLLERTLRDLRRNGLALPEEKRNELKALQKKLSDVCLAFSDNLNAEKTRLFMTKADLEGMPEDFFDGRDKAIDPSDQIEKYVVTLKYPDLIPIMKFAKKEDTRKVIGNATSKHNHSITDACPINSAWTLPTARNAKTTLH